MKTTTVSLFLIIYVAALVNGSPCLTFGPLMEMMFNRAMGFRRIGPEPGLWYGGVPVAGTFGVNGGFIPVGNGGGGGVGGGVDYGNDGGSGVVYGYGYGGGGPVYQNGNGGNGYGYGQPGGGTGENVDFGRLRRG